MLTLVLSALLVAMTCLYLRALEKIANLQLTLDGVVTFGPVRWQQMIEEMHRA